MVWKEMLSRRRILPLLLFVAIVVVMRVSSCDDQKNDAVIVTVHGNTMGTYYDIRFVGDTSQVQQAKIDSILHEFEAVFSNWVPTSEITTFNNLSTITNASAQFKLVLEESQKVYETSRGTFDPTVGPLIKRWGFGEAERKDKPTQQEIDSLLTFVGFNKIVITPTEITKPKGVEVNLSAIAKGYGCDVVAHYLDSLGIKNYKVEIGGELVCKGSKAEGKSWKIGIEKPIVGEKAIHTVIKVDNCAMATSGNYRNFFEEDGITYAHTINPLTGKPVQREILSASVIANNCMVADAFATAFMVLGLDAVKEICAERNDLDVFLIYETENKTQEVWMTEGMKKRIAE